MDNQQETNLQLIIKNVIEGSSETTRKAPLLESELKDEDIVQPSLKNNGLYIIN